MIIDLTTDTFGAVERDLDGEYWGSNVNRFVAIKAPGSAASEKSAASSCEVGYDMKGKHAMNKTAELPTFRDEVCHLGAVPFHFCSGWRISPKCLKYLGVLVRAI